MATDDKIPKTDKRDVGHAIAKGIIGAIPFAGSLGAELFALIVSPPIEARRNKWMEDIGNTIDSLKEIIDIEKLSENELFIDAITRTTQIAIRTSQKEKHFYLKNALLKVIKSQAPDAVLNDMFIQLIDQFNVWHINLLDLLDDPERWYEKSKRSFPNISTGGFDYVVEDAYPELKGKKNFYTLIFNDLSQTGLSTGGIGGMMSKAGLLARRSSDLGRNFLHFIME